MKLYKVFLIFAFIAPTILTLHSNSITACSGDYCTNCKTCPKT